MELLESDDPKTHLLRKAASQKQALTEEVKLISDKTEKVIKTALIVGGTLAATYLIYNLLSDGSSKKKKKKIKVVRAAVEDGGEEEGVDAKDSVVSGVIAKVGTALASQATVFLLSLAKEKLAEYLNNRAVKKDDNTL
jgi:hypothetical protein